MRRKAAGPRTTTKTAGKMNKSVGKSTLVAATAAFSSALIPLEPERLRVNPECLDQTRPQPLRLENDRGQAAHFLEIAPLTHFLQGLSRCKTELNLPLHDG